MTGATHHNDLQQKQNAHYAAKRLQAAYRYCHAINKAHYENFPVASLLLPRRLRPAIDAIYAFSRTADDFADEAPYAGQRLECLEAWEKLLTDPAPTHPVFEALQDACQRHAVPQVLLKDLLSAFKQDVVQARYADFSQVLDYCRRSANPVGRLVLHVAGFATPQNLLLSDDICTALQLANFWQDVAVDLQKDRIYLPADAMRECGVTEADLRAGLCDDKFRALLAAQIQRTRGFFAKGRSLGYMLPGRLGVEIRLTWLTGMRILQKIEENGLDVFRKRPELTRTDFLKMLWVALSRQRYENYVT